MHSIQSVNTYEEDRAGIEPTAFVLVRWRLDSAMEEIQRVLAELDNGCFEVAERFKQVGHVEVK